MQKSYTFLLLMFTSLIINSSLYAQNYPSSFNESKKCGDGICDAVEKNNPTLCPSDCANDKQNNHQNNRDKKCGDGVCDDNEQANPNLCPRDCPDKERYSNASEGVDRRHQAGEGEMCEGIQGIGCKHGLICKCEGNYPDASGVCVKAINESNSSSDSPFGIHAPFGGEANPARKNIDIGLIRYLTDIDTKWVRIVEPELITAGESLNKNNIKILVDMAQPFFPKDIEKYKREKAEYVRKYEDKVDAWLVVNEAELNWRDTSERFVEYFVMNAEIVRKEDPTAKVVLCLAGGKAEGGRITPRVQEFLEEALSNGIGQYFDVLDFHHQGPHNEYPDVSEKVSIFSQLFNKYSATGKEFWITEFGTHDGNPDPPRLIPKMDPPYQSEKIQASGLIKKYVYALAYGVKKMFWTTMTEWSGFGGNTNDYFTNVGLINNPSIDGQSHKKLAYYTYKKMIDILDGFDWGDISIIRESDGIYIYKFIKNGKSIWVVWNENKNEQSFTLTLDKDTKNIRTTESVPKYQSGKEIVDYNTAFTELNTTIAESSPPQTVIELKDIPIFVQEIEHL